MKTPFGKKTILVNSLLASLRRIILPFVWVNPSNVNSFLYKGFPFIGHCSIAVMFDLKSSTGIRQSRRLLVVDAMRAVRVTPRTFSTTTSYNNK